jgi:serine/threonine-protein kinase
VPVLSQNWVPLELFVRDASQRGSFDFLVVTDHDNVVKAATDTSLVGKKYVPLQNADLVVDTPDLKASSVALADGNDVFLFDTPILFQKTEIGRVRLGLNRAGMDRVLGSTLLLMSVLGALAVLAVIAMVYVFGGLLSRPLRLLSKTLTDFGAGDLDRRVSGTRKDEIGQLFSAFNHMADAIQAKFGKRSVFSDSAMTQVDGDRLRAMEQSGTMDATVATVSKRSPEGAGA